MGLWSTPMGVLFSSGVVMDGARVCATGRRWSRALWLGAALPLVVSLAAVREGRAAQSSSEGPDLAVLVLARAPMPTQVALEYSKSVDHGRLRASIDGLAARCGAEAAEVVIGETSLGGGGRRVGTAAGFLAPGLIRRETGVLPVGAVIRSLPEWRHMRVVFMVDEGFRFVGPRGGAADGIVLRLVNEMEAYEYDVEGMNGRVERPGEGIPSGRRSAPLFPALMMGVPTGFLVGWLLADRRGRERSGWG